MNILIKVTNSHIAAHRHNHDNKSGTNCPVALALADATKMKWGVGPSGWAYSKITKTIKLPYEVKNWIEKYDRGEEVKPFQF